MSPLELSQDFNNVLNLLEKDRKNLFVTGRAGTGKSTLLQLFRKTTEKKQVVLAPTGVPFIHFSTFPLVFSTPVKLKWARIRN